MSCFSQPIMFQVHVQFQVLLHLTIYMSWCGYKLHKMSYCWCQLINYMFGQQTMLYVSVYSFSFSKPTHQHSHPSHTTITPTPISQPHSKLNQSKPQPMHHILRSSSNTYRAGLIFPSILALGGHRAHAFVHQMRVHPLCPYT